MNGPRCKHFRHVMIGGEAFPISLAKELRGATDATILNMYGPTETTIWSSTHEVLGDESVISIGRPIANTQFYILDRFAPTCPHRGRGRIVYWRRQRRARILQSTGFDGRKVHSKSILRSRSAARCGRGQHHVSNRGSGTVSIRWIGRVPWDVSITR